MKDVIAPALTCLALLLTGCRDEQPAPSPEEGTIVFGKSFQDMHDGYSEAVVVQSGQLKTIYVSGQVGEGEDLETQMRSALAKLRELLGREGATTSDVVKMNTYIVDYGPETLETFRRVRREVLGDADMPASTLVGVEALALPEWLIEIEAVAVLPVLE